MNPSQPGNGASSAFSSLSIWRQKIANDLNDVPTSDDFKLRLLLDQTKELEQAVYGCLKDALFELHESASWGLLPPSFVEAQRARLHAQASQELINDKNLVLELSREHNLLKPYIQEISSAHIHTLGDYETCGELRFAMSAWKANMSQELSTTRDAHQTLVQGLVDGLRLVRRCVAGSASYWGAQQAGGAPGEAETAAVMSAAEEKLRLLLGDMAESHHLGKEAVAAAWDAVSEEPNMLQRPEKLGGDDDKRYLVPSVKEKYNVEEAARREKSWEV